MANFKEDIAKIKAFAFDVDGIFTDGGITPTTDGDFLRTYNAKDGYAVAFAIRKGYPVAIITGGKGRNLEARFVDALRVPYFRKDCIDKIEYLEEFMAQNGLERDEVIFMGDDLPDVECMKHVTMGIAPADGVPEVIEAARYVSRFGGGRGCVRDIIEQVLRARGDWGHERGFAVTSR